MMCNVIVECSFTLPADVSIQPSSMQLASIFKDMKESSFMLADVAPFFPIFYSRFFIFEASAIMEASGGDIQLH